MEEIKNEQAQENEVQSQISNDPKIDILNEKIE